MQKVSDIVLQNMRNLPIWVKQVVTKEIFEDLEKKLADFSELSETDSLFQSMLPKVSVKGKQEIVARMLNLSEAFYTFLIDAQEGCDIFEITIKNNWSLADTAKIFIKLFELELVIISDNDSDKTVAIAMFIAGKIKTGEFLKRIGKIDALQLEQAIRYQKQLNDEGRHIKMASILIKLGFITNKGLDSLLLLKEEAKKRMPVTIGIAALHFDDKDAELTQIDRLQREVSRLESENLIMKKRLKKLLKLDV